MRKPSDHRALMDTDTQAEGVSSPSYQFALPFSERESVLPVAEEIRHEVHTFYSTRLEERLWECVKSLSSTPDAQVYKGIRDQVASLAAAVEEAIRPKEPHEEFYKVDPEEDVHAELAQYVDSYTKPLLRDAVRFVLYQLMVEALATARDARGWAPWCNAESGMAGMSPTELFELSRCISHPLLRWRLEVRRGRQKGSLLDGECRAIKSMVIRLVRQWERAQELYRKNSGNPEWPKIVLDDNYTLPPTLVLRLHTREGGDPSESSPKNLALVHAAYLCSDRQKFYSARHVRRMCAFRKSKPPVNSQK